MSEHQPPASHCANCGHRLAPWDHFCSQCGQDTAGHPPSLWEFVHEWLLHYVAFEGKLWKSLWALLAKPGFLTQEYLAGRKQRYVLPLRLLLSFGLLFFVALKFSPDLLDQAVQLDEAAQAAGRAASQPAAARPAAALPPAAASALQGALQQAARETASAPASPVVMNAKDREGLPAWLRGPLERVEKRWAQNREAATLQFKSTLLALAPYAVLLSLPLFAGLLKLLLPQQLYGAHFLFAMHLHAAWYLMLLLLVLLGSINGVALALWLWSNLYPLKALRLVHGLSWPSTLWRAALLALMHWGLLCVLLLGLLAAGALAL